MWRNHGNVDVCKSAWGSQSTLRHGYEVWTEKCPSIGSRISTCGWTVVHMMSTHSGGTQCGSMDPEGSVDIPMMQDEGKLVLDWVLQDRSHHRGLAVLLVDVERLIASGQRKLDWDVLMGSLKWIVDGYVLILVEMTDMFVSMVWPDEGCVEQRLDVCLVSHGDDGSETESDVESVVVVVELQAVEKDNLEWVERFELVVEPEQDVVGSYCALGSCPQMPAYWTPRCSSSVVSSPLH